MVFDEKAKPTDVPKEGDLELEDKYDEDIEEILSPILLGSATGSATSSSSATSTNEEGPLRGSEGATASTDRSDESTSTSTNAADVSAADQQVQEVATNSKADSSPTEDVSAGEDFIAENAPPQPPPTPNTQPEARRSGRNTNRPNYQALYREGRSDFVARAVRLAADTGSVPSSMSEALHRSNREQWMEAAQVELANHQHQQT